MFTSADGQNWGEPVATGAFKRNAELHAVKFAKPVEAPLLEICGGQQL